MDLTITDRNDPLYPTVDHIIPVSVLMAENPNHPLLNNHRNLRPAHMGCNSKRGNASPKPLKLSRDWRS